MDRQTGGEADWPGRGALYDLAGCLRFYSRLPVPQLPGEPDPHRSPDFTTLPRMLPLAGLILALPAALVLAAGWAVGLGPFLAATLAVAVAVVATGALHEDGLADVADGFGGGATRERRLEIMRDSRIGAYGGAALVLALALRIGALATLLDRIRPRGRDRPDPGGRAVAGRRPRPDGAAARRRGRAASPPRLAARTGRASPPRSASARCWRSAPCRSACPSAGSR